MAAIVRELTDGRTVTLADLRQPVHVALEVLSSVASLDVAG